MGASTVTGYQILRKRLCERDLVVHVEDTGSADATYLDTIDIEPETTYVYWVKAINGAGVGDRSNVDSFVERPVRDGPWSARVSGREAPRAVGC